MASTNPLISIKQFLEYFKSFRTLLNEYDLTSSFNSSLDDPSTRLRIRANKNEENIRLAQFLFDLIGCVRFEYRGFICYEETVTVLKNNALRGTVAAICRKRIEDPEGYKYFAVTAVHVLRRSPTDVFCLRQSADHVIRYYEFDFEGMDSVRDIALLPLLSDFQFSTRMNENISSISTVPDLNIPVQRYGATTDRSQMTLVEFDYCGTIWLGEELERTAYYLHIAESTSQVEGGGDSGGPWWQNQSLIGVHWSYGFYCDLNSTEKSPVRPNANCRFHFASSVNMCDFLVGLEF
jgi:hypothetical protein